LIERVRTAPPGRVGAVTFYDQDRFHRNDVEFFQFMVGMEERRVLVFDGHGLVSNVDKLSWKIRAIVAQEERERVAHRRATCARSGPSRTGYGSRQPPLSRTGRPSEDRGVRDLGDGALPSRTPAARPISSCVRSST
jgi:DNA invertase Pin-like site-specific DNA recombinase